MFSFEYSLPVALVMTIVSLVFVIFCYRRKSFSYWKDRGVPYLEPDWTFGNVKDQFLQRSSWMDFSTRCYNAFKDKGFGGFFVLNHPCLVVCSPKLVETVLIHDFSNFHDRSKKKLGELMFKTLFHASGKQWRTMRYKLTPSFTSIKVKGMFDQILRCCELSFNQIRDQEPLNVQSLVFVYSTEVIASCAFGLQLLSDNDGYDTFTNAINCMFDQSKFGLVKFVLVSLFPKLMSRLGFSIVSQVTSEFFLTLTKDTMRYRKEKKIQRNDFLNLLMALKNQEDAGLQSDDDSSYYLEDKLFLHHFMNNLPSDQPKDKIFTEDRIAALVFNFITGGLKPTVSNISFALFEIAKNPMIEEKIFHELQSTLGKHKGWSYEAVRDMVYLDQVLQETLRMYSVNTFLVRIVTETYTLPGTGVTLEEGLPVYIPVSALHSDPDFFPCPELFDPERFAGNNFKPTSCFMPFGNGPRICIAMKFATLTMKVFLAKTLEKFRVRVSDRTELPFVFDEKDLSPKPKGGIWLSFLKRK